jgi:hypothetical protein
MKQEFSTLYSWEEAINISIFSSLMPIRKEALKAVNGTPLLKPVVQSFVPIVGSDGRSSGIYQYVPSIYTLLDMNSNNPLTKIDLQVYWEDRNNKFHQLTLAPGKTAFFKMMFTKKVNT